MRVYKRIWAQLTFFHAIIFLLQVTSSENYVVVKDYVADVDGFAVNVGDIVEAIEHDGSAK